MRSAALRSATTVIAFLAKSRVIHRLLGFRDGKKPKPRFAQCPEALTAQAGEQAASGR
jgi:hypothetical protein